MKHYNYINLNYIYIKKERLYCNIIIVKNFFILFLLLLLFFFFQFLPISFYFSELITSEKGVNRQELILDRMPTLHPGISPFRG